MSGGPPIAFSYVRMSTGAQLKGDSLRRQSELSAKYAASHGLQMASGAEYHDIGVSAFKSGNSKDGALGKFVEAAESGSIPKGSYLLVESFDRLSRDKPDDALTLFLRIVNAGVTIVTLADEKVFKKGLQVNDLLYSIMIMGRAHEESQIKSQRIGASWKSKRKNAGSKRLTSISPAWLSPKGDAGFEVIKDRAKIVNEIFEAAANGQGSYSIARKLNERNVPKFSTKGKPGWQPSYITKILTNKSVLGEFQPHKIVDGNRVPEGDVLKGYFPPIIDENLFHAAHAGRSDRKVGGAGRKGHEVPNLFSGLVKCIYCHGPMHFINKGKGETYFQCDKARRNLGCIKTSWRCRDFETSFLSFVAEVDLKTLFSKSDTVAKRASLEERMNRLKGEIAATEKKRDETYALLGSGPSAEFLRSKLDEHSLKLTSLRTELDQATVEMSALNEEERAFLSDGKELSTFIKRLQKSKSGNTRDLRLAVAGRIKSVVNSIHLASEGSAARLAQSQEFLKKQSGKIPEEDLRKIADHIKSTSNSDPVFVVGFKSGAWRTVRPKPGKPAQVVYSIATTDDFGKGAPAHFDADNSAG